jgi:hypothetical protein
MSSAPASTTRAVRLVVLLSRPYEAPDRPAPGLLGCCESAALRAAVRLRDRLGGTLVALAMGADEPERPALAAALAAGCNRAVRVHAPDCDGLDYLGVATVLATAVRRLGCDLLLCGDTGENERTGAMGPAVAELLGIAHLTGVVDVDVEGRPDGTASETASETASDTGPTLVVAHRGSGRIHRFRWSLPAALCLLAPVPAPAAEARAGGSEGSEGREGRDGSDGSEGRDGSDGSEGRDAATASETRGEPGGQAGGEPAGEPRGEPVIETLGLDALGIHAKALAHRRRLLGQADTDVGRGAIVVAGADDLVSRLVADGMLP